MYTGKDGPISRRIGKGKLMSGRTCSLCGGRLDRNNICRECGLDNTKSDANYSMRQNTADYGELTHTHHTPKTYGWEEKTVQKKRKFRFRDLDTGRRLYPALIAIAVMALLDILFGFAAEILSALGVF